MISAIGGFIGILLVLAISSFLLPVDTVVYIVPSMGASAVLLFAVPHSPLTQPWNLVGGHLLSATIGVACAQWIPDMIFAASVSVGLSIGIMYLTRSIHPPGGATALAAVIGGTQIQELGYWYVINPVLINVVVILLVAILFNYMFAWRRYPAFCCKEYRKLISNETKYSAIKHENFVYALSQIDSFIDVSEEDLLRIYDLATKVHKLDKPK